MYIRTSVHLQEMTYDIVKVPSITPIISMAFNELRNREISEREFSKAYLRSSTVKKSGMFVPVFMVMFVSKNLGAKYGRTNCRRKLRFG